MKHRAVLNSKNEVPLDNRFLLTIANSENTKTPIANDGETNLTWSESGYRNHAKD
jgi:hypothetical protein